MKDEPEISCILLDDIAKAIRLHLVEPAPILEKIEQVREINRQLRFQNRDLKTSNDRLKIQVAMTVEQFDHPNIYIVKEEEKK